MTTTVTAQGPLEASVRERDGFCPVCMTNRPSLPTPAEGTCAYCFNHLMKPCRDCANYMHRDGVDPICFGDDGHRYSAWYARSNDELCGAGAKWGKFPNAKVTGDSPALMEKRPVD